MKKLIIGIVLVAGIMISGSILAQKSERNFKGRPEMREMGQLQKHEGLMKDSLTSQQMEAIKEIKGKTEKELKPLHDQLSELMAHHRTLMTAEKPDMAAINASIEKMGALKISVEKAEAAQQQEIRKLLTEKQRIQMDKNRNDRFGGRDQQRSQSGKMHGSDSKI
ncbi:MAG: periplasmic heavy metal sensor [Mariniphaga sp.]